MSCAGVAVGVSETLLLIICAATASLASCQHAGQREVDKRGERIKIQIAHRYKLHHPITIMIIVTEVMREHTPAQFADQSAIPWIQASLATSFCPRFPEARLC